MNLDQYFNRIGYRSGTEPSLDNLHALTRAHAQSIAFENLDVLAGKPISLELDNIFDKLVLRRRGGYCFEHNGLFMWVLQQLGYQVSTLGARVRLRTPDRDDLPGRTHLLLKVELDGQSWLTDVGFGGFSRTAALRWQDGLEQQAPHDRRRLVYEDRRWFHQVWQENHWLDVYEFDGLPMPDSDQKVANWYTSTHPDSTFMDQRIVARAGADGSRLALLGNELRIRTPTGDLETRNLAETEITQTLKDVFYLDYANYNGS